MKSIRGIPLNALVDYKKGNLGSLALGLFYLIFPWLSSGTLDETMAIFGLMFVTISVMRAKASNAVLAGLCQAFIGVIYLFAIGGIIQIQLLWTFVILLTIVFFILELGFFKIGPVTKKADTFQIVPFTILTFGLLLSLVGYSTLFQISWTNTLVALNYVAVFLFSAISMLQLAGWNVGGKHTNMWLSIFAIAAIATALAGTYQGTLFQWR